MPTSSDTSSSALSPEPEWLALVRVQVEKLRFGVIQLVVHDGRVIQVEFTEKTRLGPGVAPLAPRAKP